MAKIVLSGQLRRDKVSAVVGGHYHPVQAIAGLAAPDLAAGAAGGDRRAPRPQALCTCRRRRRDHRNGHEPRALKRRAAR
jgi:hypothetical protein